MNGARYEDAGKWYCKTHHPPTIKENIRAWSQKWKWEQGLREKQAKWSAEARERQERDRRAALYPELLEALVDLADAGAEAWGEDRPCVEIARAAIAKAEGQA